jgi:hypothetical protein
MKSSVFWDIKAALFVEINRRVERNNSPSSSGAKKKTSMKPV